MAAKNKNCTYRHCRYENKEIPFGEEIKVGARYYHNQCSQESDNIKQIKQLYFDSVSNTVVPSVLGKVVNDIVYGKNIESDYLLFVIKYIISHKLKITYPYGLHYKIDDNRIKDAYQKEKARLVSKSITFDITCDSSNDIVFIRKPKEKSQLENMF